MALDALPVHGPEAPRIGHVVGDEHEVGGEQLRPVPALTLGVFEITPLQLARAYLPLANGGLAPAGGAVEAVADDGGRALWSASREVRPCPSIVAMTSKT